MQRCLLPAPLLPWRRSRGRVARAASLGAARSDRSATRDADRDHRRPGSAAPGVQKLIADIEQVIADRVASHPRAQLLQRLSGVGIINLAQLLAEVGPILDRADSAEHATANVTQRKSPRTPGIQPTPTSAGQPTARRPAINRLRPRRPAAVTEHVAPHTGPRRAGTW